VKRPILRPSLPIVLAGLAACTSSLSREKRAWERGRPSSYIFEYQYTCFCPGSGAWWKVAVDGDAVTNVDLIDSTQVRRGLTYLRSLRQPTLSGLFDEIAQWTAPASATYHVNYDPQWHFPAAAQGVDFNRTDSRWTIVVRRFQAGRSGSK